jgi:hypothetical protein
MNDVFAAIAGESDVLSLELVPLLFDPGEFDPESLFRVLLIATPVTDSLVALLGKVELVVVST